MANVTLTDEEVLTDSANGQQGSMQALDFDTLSEQAQTIFNDNDFDLSIRLTGIELVKRIRQHVADRSLSEDDAIDLIRGVLASIIYSKREYAKFAGQ